MPRLTTVLFRSRILGFVPGWLALVLVLGGTAAATVPVFNGSINLPTNATLGGTAVQPNSAAVGLQYRAATSGNSMSDLLDLLGPASGTCDEPTYLCINPANAQDVVGLKLFNYSTTRAGIAVSDNGTGDAIFVGLNSPSSAYGVDVANYNAASQGPMLVLNNSTLALAGPVSNSMTLAQLEDYGNASTVVNTVAQLGTGSWLVLNTNTNTWSGNGIFINAAQGGTGAFTGRFVDFEVNGSDKYYIDSSGDPVTAGAYTFTTGGASVSSNSTGTLFMNAAGGHFAALNFSTGNFVLNGGGAFVGANGSATSCTGGYTFANGIMVITGAGAPTCTAPAGSEYLRSDGASGTRLYISAGSGTWNAVAGV